MGTFWCGDSFSRWVEALSLLDQSAVSIAKILHDEIFCRFDAPVSIISNRGQHFLSKLCNAVLEIYKVARHMTIDIDVEDLLCVEYI